MWLNNHKKSYRVYNPGTQRTMESWNAIFIKMSSRLLPPPSKETPPRLRVDYYYSTQKESAPPLVPPGRGLVCTTFASTRRC